MEDLLEVLYSGIANTRNWGMFCEKLSQLFDANSAIIISINQPFNQSKYSASYGISPTTLTQLAIFLPNNDPRINIAREQKNKAHIFDPSSALYNNPNNLFSSSLIYQDILRHNDIEHHLVLAINIDENEDIFILLTKKADKEAFTLSDKRKLEKLSTDIKRAIKIQKKHANNDTYIRAGLNSLKMQPVGSIIANANNKVFHCNDYAKSILEKKDGLLLLNNYIYHGTLKASCLLSTKINLTLDADPENMISIKRKDSSHPYQLMVKPFQVRHTPFQAEDNATNMVHIFILDPDKEFNITTTLLQNIFGLTTCEAKLASALTKHCNLKTTQNELNISANTARTHLKHIFQKMNVSSQVELVKLITTSYLWSSEK
ncbi:helix-turn-helix transcriptional regulator [Psychromonas hadalis]|uniref:helix-turn-helix transcriptional regulator n=1 Tax=Psychromonas hadalis TaxID=211669 RepID=UPI0003B3634A|nr:LuxR C-terminal-related transcriptional regulator [Psychromonas hadalis]